MGVLGLGILVAGIAGRRSGGLAPLAVIGMIAAVGTTAAPTALSQPWHWGDEQHAVTSMTPPPAFELGVGQLRVDLTGAAYATTPTKPDHVRATLGVGELDIVVPAGVTVVVNAHARAGELVVDGRAATVTGMTDNGNGGMHRGGTDWRETVTFGPASAAPEIVVDAEVGLGQINLTTGSAAS